MSTYVGDFATIEEAWLATLRAVEAGVDGRVTNLMVSIQDPVAAISPAVAEIIDPVLLERGQQRVSTVANTLFMSRLYRDPAIAWSPDLSDEDKARVDKAAVDFYRRYLDMLDTLKTDAANKSGTYLSRLITWPGREVGGINQLDKRITYLRQARVRGDSSHSASDVSVGGEGDDLAGLQEYAASDDRQQGFPCLVHISLTVHEGRLSLSATYRHWYVITRGYGNIVGLARIQAFLAQQSGYEVGELVVIATKANAERSRYTRRGIARLAEAVDTVLADESATLEAVSA